MKNLLIIGGCGFIGSNAVLYFLKKNYRVSVIDNLSGSSSKKNLNLIKKTYPKINFSKVNIKNYKNLSQFIKKLKPNYIIFAAGQVAVTKSVQNPREDFESTMLGAFNVLESIRNYSSKSSLIYSSSNKVYGNLKKLKILEKKDCYQIRNKSMLIKETQELDFSSPYGCSKGASDQYVRDYSRTYNLKTVVFRMSCIYGPNQWGTEDQGWISWFIKKSLRKNNQSINIFGNGKQVRDILFIEDLIKLYEISIKKFYKINGEIFNIGGGYENKISLLQLIKKLKKINNHNLKIKFYKERIGDQKYFVNNLKKIKKTLSWKPRISINKGIDIFNHWIKNNNLK
jgi:CDP-paratose 2-epimerase